MQEPNELGGDCVILGSGIAGLLAAHVAKKSFANVTLVDRENIMLSRKRSGIPQADHLHVILGRGWLELERMFPSLGSDLAKSGCPEADLGRDIRYLNFAGWLPPVDIGCVSRTASRQLLERTIRGYVLSDRDPSTQIRFLHGRAVGLLMETSAAVPIVNGVKVSTPDGYEQLSADMVIDATGRYSRLGVWLRAANISLPDPIVVDSFNQYATRWYRIPSERVADFKALIILSRPPDVPRGGMAQRVEDDLWVVTVGSFAKNAAPTDSQEFLAHAKSLPDQALYQLIGRGEPVTDVANFKDLSGIHRQYEAVKRWPVGLLAIGDSSCCFNPIYGHGVTTAAVEASVLEKEWRRCCYRGESPARMSSVIQRRLSRTKRQPWLLSTTEDYRWSVTTGPERKLSTRLLQSYVDHVFSLAPHSRDVARRILRVMHLMDTPASLVTSRILSSFVGACSRRAQVRLRSSEWHRRGSAIGLDTRPSD